MASHRSPRETEADARTGLVPRARLVRRLIAARDVPLVVLVAPAGYGKTTLVSEWSMQDNRSFAWVALRDRDNDPLQLKRSIATALRKRAARGPMVLVLEHVDALAAPDALATLSQLIQANGPATQLALVSRVEPRLGLGGLRARRELLEVRTADLAMTASEAAALIRWHGLDPNPRGLDRLVHHTEGWPTGLYLAALAARDALHPARALAGFSGSDRFVADYIGEELLAALPADQLAFLRRTSVLDSLSGPLCDHVLERTGSAELLKTLSRMNLMIVALDRSDTEYRYHRLFAEALRGELRRSEPGLEAVLHGRASIWYAQHGELERSIQHAVAAGDVARAGRLLWSRSATILGYGQGRKLDDWLAAFGQEQIAGCAELALTAAASGLFAGDRELVENWTASATHAVSGDDRTLRAHIALIRCAVADGSLRRMGEDAETACADLPVDSGWRALAHLLAGVAHHLSGARETARRLLEDGARSAAARFPPVQALCLSQLCLHSIERGDWAAADSLAARAKAQVERSGLRDCATSALVYAVSADVEARTGRVEASQADTRQASSLLVGLVDFSPWYEGECRIALARAALRLGDVAGARVLLSQAAGQLERSSDAEAALGWIDACRAQADLSAMSSPGDGWSLTTAELRVLQFLPTHLSFPEVAERLYVSANTIKTHARSVYRKLGASSRGEAVVLARAAGLLDEASHAGVGTSSLAAFG